MSDPDFEPLPDEDPDFEPLPEEAEEINALDTARELTVDRDPERDARVLGISRRTGLDPGLVEHDPDAVESMWQEGQFDVAAWGKKHPALRNLVEKDPRLARVVTKDKQLSALDVAINKAVDFRQAVGEAGWDKVENFLGFNPIAVNPMGAVEQAGKVVYDYATGQQKNAEQRREADRVKPASVSYLQDAETDRFDALREEYPVAAGLVATAERFKEAYAQGEITGLQGQLLRMRQANAFGIPGKDLPLIGHVGGGDTSELEARIAEKEAAAIPRDYAEGALGQVGSDFAAGMASQVGLLETAGPLAIAGGLVGAAVGVKSKAGPLAGAKAGFELTLKAGVAIGSFNMESGSSYGRLLKTTTEDGRKLTEPEARGGAIVEGVIKSAIETVGTIAELRAAKGIAGALRAPKMGTDAVARSFAARLAGAASGFAVGAQAEGLEEGFQEGTDQLGDWVLSSLVDGRLQSRAPLDRDALLESYSAGVIGGVGSTAAFGAGHLALQAVKDFTVESLRRDESEVAAKHVAAISTLKDSLTAKASPEAVAEAVAAMTGKQGPPATHMQVDAQAFVTFFQSENKDVNEAAVEHLGPDGAKHLQEALQSGGKLEVPMAKYVETWVPSGAAEKLAPHTTTRPHLDTAAEAETRTKDEEALTKQLVEQAEAESTGTVAEDVTPGEAAWAKRLEQQLMASYKVTAKEARAAMAPVRARIRTAAIRSGKTAGELFGDLRLTIEGEAAEEISDADETDADVTTPDYQGATEHIGRMKDAEKQAASKAWVDFVRGDSMQRPDVSDDVKRDLSRFGVWPEGEPITFDEAGRSLERVLGGKRKPNERRGGGARPEALARDYYERNAPGMVAQYGYIPGTVKKTRYGQADLLTESEKSEPRSVSTPESIALAEKLRRDKALPDEQRAAKLGAEVGIDSLGGLRTRLAFTSQPVPAGKMVAVVTSPDIKPINDHPTAGGHDVANELLLSVGSTIGGLVPDAARSATNFAFIVDDEAQMLGVLDKLREAHPGVTFEGNVGPTLEDASQALDDLVDAERFVGLVEQRGSTKLDVEKFKAPAADRAKGVVPGDFAATQAAMSEKEFFERHYVTDGILTAVGREALGIPPKANFAAFDVKGLGKANKRFKSKAVGNQMLSLIKRAMWQEGGSEVLVTLRGGDEFSAEHDDPKVLQRWVDRVSKALDGVTVEGEDPATGKTVHESVGFRHGFGLDYGKADRDLNAGRRAEAAAEAAGRLDAFQAEAVQAREARLGSERGAESGSGRGRPQAYPDEVAGRFYEEDAAGVRGFTEISRKALERYFRIVLTAKADKSTFLHESAHVFFELMADLAERPDAPQQVRDDYAALLKFTGAESRKDVATEHHEKFARGWEVYLAEGRAPSLSLVGAFTRFRLWLTNIYKSLTSLNVELSDEVRGIFDRMLATDAEIAAAKRTTGFDVGRLGPEMFASPEEYADYLRVKEKAVSNANQAATQRVLADKLRETEEWWRQEEDALLAEADKAYDKLPAQQARGSLAEMELDKDAVVAAVGEQAAEQFKTVGGAIAGAMPDDVADLLGFPTGEAMLKAVAALPSRESWTRAEARRQMEERHPDISNDIRRMRGLAEKVLQKEPLTARTLLKEWEALRRKAGMPPTAPIDAVRQAARQIAERRAIGRIDAGRALVQERAAAERCAKFVAKGEFEQAAVAKQQQILNMFLHGALTQAREERDAFLELADKATKETSRARLGKGSPVYRDGVDLLLESFGLADPRERELPLPSLGEVTSQMEADGATVGFDVDAVGRLLAKPKDWRELSLAEMRLVRDAVKNVQGAGRSKATVLINGKRQDKAEVVAALIADAAKNLPDVKRLPSSESARSLGEKAIGGLASADGSLLKPETMIRWLAGDDLDSPWFQALMKPLQDAKSREVDILESSVKPIVDAFDKMPKAVRASFMDSVDGAALFPSHRSDVPAPTKRFELLMMALNAGNASNLQRLLEGRSITHEQLGKSLDLLTKEEMDFVQSVWDASESLRPLSFDLEERDSGLRPTAIKATPVVTSKGEWKGGYFPAAYDRRVETVGEMQQAETIASLMDQSYTRPGTSRSHLKSRARNFSGALSLEPATISAHLAQVAHDIAFREAVKSVGSLVMTPEIKATLRDRLGDERSRTFLQWVKDVGQMRGIEGAQHSAVFLKALRHLRANTVVAALGYSLPNAIEDLTNLPAAVARTELKAKHLTAALLELGSSPLAMPGECAAKSGELRTRHAQVQRELQKRVTELTATGPMSRGPLRFLKEHAFVFMEFSDKYTSSAVWLGAYRQALAAEKSEAKAIEFADAIVRQVFPSHSAVDAAAILRDKGAVGMMFQFYGFLNVYYNGLRDLSAQFGRADTVAEKAKVAGQLLGYMLAVSVLSEVLRGRGPDDDEDKMAWMLRKLALAPFSAVPFVGDAISYAESKLTGKRAAPVRASPMLAVGRETYDALSNLPNEDRDASRRVLDLLRATAPITGLPISGTVRTGKYVDQILQKAVGE